MRNRLGDRVKVFLSQFRIKFFCFAFFLGGFSSEVFCSSGGRAQNTRSEIFFLIPTFKGPREITLPIDMFSISSLKEDFCPLKSFKQHMVRSYSRNALKEGDALYSPLTGFLRIPKREELFDFVASCCELAIFETREKRWERSPRVIKVCSENSIFVGKELRVEGRAVGTKKDPILILGNRSLKSSHHVFNQALREMVKGFASDKQGPLLNSVTNYFYRRVIRAFKACWSFQGDPLTIAINKVQGKCSRSALVFLEGAPDSNFGPPEGCSFFPENLMHLIFDFNQMNFSFASLKNALGCLLRANGSREEKIGVQKVKDEVGVMLEPFTSLSLRFPFKDKTTFSFPRWVDSSMISYIILSSRIPSKNNKVRRDFVSVQHVLEFFEHLEERVKVLPNDVLRMRRIFEKSSFSSCSPPVEVIDPSSFAFSYLDNMPVGFFKERSTLHQGEDLEASLLQSPLEYEKEKEIPLSQIQVQPLVVSLLEDAVRDDVIAAELKEEALYELKVRLRRQYRRSSLVASYLGEKAPRVQYSKIPPETIKGFVVAYLSRVGLHKKEDIVQLVQNIFRRFLESENFRATRSLPHSDNLAKEIFNGFCQEVIPEAQNVWKRKKSDYVIPSPDGMSRRHRDEFLELARGISSRNFKFIGPKEGTIVGNFLCRKLGSEEYQKFKAWGKKRLPR